MIARFIEASAARDTDAALAILTAGSREGFDINGTSFEEATIHIGEVESEEGHFVVSTSLEDEDGANEMPFVVREEGGELRVDRGWEDPSDGDDGRGREASVDRDPLRPVG